MPIKEEVAAQRPDVAERRPVGVTVKTITPTVFLTGLYTANPEAKATELTRLLQNLLEFGIWENVLDAAKNGVPAGTYVVVDDPKTPAKDFSVQIVPKIFKKRPADAVEVGPRQ